MTVDRLEQARSLRGALLLCLLCLCLWAALHCQVWACLVFFRISRGITHDDWIACCQGPRATGFSLAALSGMNVISRLHDLPPGGSHAFLFAFKMQSKGWLDQVHTAHSSILCDLHRVSEYGVSRRAPRLYNTKILRAAEQAITSRPALACIQAQHAVRDAPAHSSNDWVKLLLAT